MSNSQRREQQAADNKRMAFILGSIAAVFFIGIMIKNVFFG